MLEPVTIDQLRVLVSIVEAGSFSAAARRLQRAQSGISQAIATLEDQLQLTLFDRSGRRPTLTAEGAVVVEDARAVIAKAQALRARARLLSGGVEPNVTLAVSLLVPAPVLSDVLGRFERDFPDTDLRVLVQEASGPVDSVAAGRADLGIAGAYSVDGGTEALRRVAIGTIPIVAVASVSLIRTDGIDGSELAERIARERQLVSTGGGAHAPTPTLSRRTWLVGDQALRRHLLLSGFGWAVMPRHVVDADIKSGVLRVLDLEGYGVPTTETLMAIRDPADPPGPATQWLLDALEHALRVA